MATNPTFYEVEHTDVQTYGKITVENQKINNETSLNLVGKNSVDYAKPIAENFLHLLENFAKGEPPENPVAGQLWYDTNTSVELPQLKQPQLKIYDGTSWVPAGNVSKSVSQPKIAALGDIWVNTLTQQLYICTGSNFDYQSSDSFSNWTLVGPEYSLGTQTGPKVESLLDISGQERPVISLIVNGHIIAIISSVAFVPKVALAGFETIKQGINLTKVDNINNITTLNKIWGVAEKADALVVGNNTVPSSNFLRSDTTSTTNFGLNIKNNSGLKIGTGLTTQLYNTNNNETLLVNSVNDARIYVRTTADNVTDNAITIYRKNVGIGKEANVDFGLDVNGNVRSSGSLTVTSTTAATNAVGSIRTSGGISAAGNLVVGGTAAITGAITTTSLTPSVTDTSDIGSTSKRYNNVYAKRVKADTIEGTFNGTFVGNVAGSAQSLITPTSFSITGEITADPVSFNGTQQNIVLQAKLDPGAINSQAELFNSFPTDEILIHRNGFNLKKVTKQTFISNIPTVPVGTILPYAGQTPPPGYLFCDGGEQLTSRYPELFSVIGYTYKSLGALQGVATFALPDLRGRFALGRDNMNNGTTVPDKTNPSSQISTITASADRVTTTTADNLGQGSGAENQEIKIENLPNHSHNLQGQNGTQFFATTYIPPGTGTVLDGQTGGMAAPAPEDSASGHFLDNAGRVINTNGSVVSELSKKLDIMNPYATINYIIFTGRIE